MKKKDVLAMRTRKKRTLETNKMANMDTLENAEVHGNLLNSYWLPTL